MSKKSQKKYITHKQAVVVGMGIQRVEFFMNDRSLRKYRINSIRKDMDGEHVHLKLERIDEPRPMRPFSMMAIPLSHLRSLFDAAAYLPKGGKVELTEENGFRTELVTP